MNLLHSFENANRSAAYRNGSKTQLLQFDYSFSFVIDFAGQSDYNNAIFCERTVNTMTISTMYIKMPELNTNNYKHGVCPVCSAMC